MRIFVCVCGACTGDCGGGPAAVMAGINLILARKAPSLWMRERECLSAPEWICIICTHYPAPILLRRCHQQLLYYSNATHCIRIIFCRSAATSAATTRAHALTLLAKCAFLFQLSFFSGCVSFVVCARESDSLQIMNYHARQKWRTW